MAYINDLAFDACINYIITGANRLDICSTEPTTYAQATSTLTLGNKLTPSLGAVSDRTGGGRKTTVSAITGGNVTGNGTAGFWALVDTGNSRLLATGALSVTQAVTSGNTFSLATFDIGVSDAV